jgi:CheY-like chemotaxis protein
MMDGALSSIAVLDDEAEYRKALSRLLKASGYEVEAFAEGVSLLARLAQRRFGCVLLDLNMPGMNGFDVLAELHGEVRPPRVIVLTANDDPAMMKRALALNAFDYQLKPIAAPALLGAIARALGR